MATSSLPVGFDIVSNESSPSCYGRDCLEVGCDGNCSSLDSANVLIPIDDSFIANEENIPEVVRSDPGQMEKLKHSTSQNCSR